MLTAANTVPKESGQLELECHEIISCILLLNILCLICIGLSAEGEWDDLAIEWHLWSQPNNRPVHGRALSVILSWEQLIGWNTETRILRARQSTCPCQSLGPIVGNPRLSMATAMNLSIERNHSYLSKMRFSSSCWMTTWQVTKVGGCRSVLLKLRLAGRFSSAGQSRVKDMVLTGYLGQRKSM